jgi:hypothetical protein
VRNLNGLPANCTEVQRRISECLDGGEPPDEERRLKKHLDECWECSRLYEDLKSIKETAAELDAPEPPDTLWSSVRLQLVQEGLVRDRKPTLWERVFPRGFASSLKPAFVGAILALFVIGIAYYVRDSRKHLPPSTESAVLLEVQRAESHYQKAINALDAVSQKRLQSLSPELAQIFTDNLATMDYYLKECQDAARKNPDNPLVHQYLLVAYEKKAELMQTIVNSDSQ